MVLASTAHGLLACIFPCRGAEWASAAASYQLLLCVRVCCGSICTALSSVNAAKWYVHSCFTLFYSILRKVTHVMTARVCAVLILVVVHVATAWQNLTTTLVQKFGRVRLRKTG